MSCPQMLDKIVSEFLMPLFIFNLFVYPEKLGHHIWIVALVFLLPQLLTPILIIVISPNIGVISLILNYHIMHDHICCQYVP